MLVGSVNKGALDALSYARSLAPDRLLAVSVVGDPAEQEELTRSWDEHNIPVELHTIYSPYRELTRPVIQYLDELDAGVARRDDHRGHPRVRHRRGRRSSSTTRAPCALKARLLYRPNTVVTSVPVLVE